MEKYIGKKYNKLTIIKYEYTDKSYYKHYLCKCDCGKEKILNINNVKTGRTKSCGCNYKEILGNLYKKQNKYEIKDDYIIGYATNTNNKFYIDKEDYDKIKNICWYELQTGYMAHHDKEKNITTLHRFILNVPKDKVVDHINHNKKDNRRKNLRIVTQRENVINKKNKPKGITKHKVGNCEYYMVQLCGYRGNYKSYNEAKKVRDEIIKNEYTLQGEIINENI